MTSTKVRQYLRSHVLGLVAIFVAFSGTAVAGGQSGDDGGPKASASVVTDAKFKKLKKRVAALEAAAKVPGPPGATGATGATGPPGPATGPAGGVLTGTYPNPGLGANVVGSGNVIDGSLGFVDLKSTYAAVTAGSDPAAGFVTETATCNAGDRVLGGGYSWDEDGTQRVVFSTPDPLANPNQWLARGGATGANNTFRAWALCLTG
jgi:hypothetical protein